MTDIHSREEKASYPAGWQQRRLKLLVSRFFSGGTPSTSQQDYWDGDIPWVSPKDMKSSSISFSADKITELALADNNLPLLDPGHVLMVVRSGILRHSIPIAVNSLPVSINQDIKAMRLCPDIDPFYFRYFVDGLQNHLLNLWRKPGTTVESLEYNYYSEHLIPVPPLATQQRIAHFLDEKTARIDALIEKKRALLDRLAEKRQALITRAVTKGLNPDAPMKPSGIDWLGDIPAHWEVKRLKYISPKVTVGIVVTPAAYYSDEGVLAIRGLNIRPMGFDFTETRNISKDGHALHLKSELYEGDLVAVRTGDPGTTSVITSDLEGTNCVDLVIVRKPRNSSSRFLGWFLNSDAAKVQYAIGSEGALQLHFNVETSKEVAVSVPPFEEQANIAEFIDQELKLEKERAAKVEQSIDLLQEYRSALITAAVTGQIVELR